MRLLAPAKINLFLRVGPRREDGYHGLLSWFCTVGLFDTLTVRRRDASRGEPLVKLETNQSDLPCDEKNLVVRAATALADICGRLGEGTGTRMEGVSAFLEKRIPVGAGLAGGSSDAARAMLGLNKLWNLNLPIPRLAEIAATLGSDVPFFFHGPSSICSGRGEVVRPIDVPAPKIAVLVMPAAALSTALVYGRFDELRLGREVIGEDVDWTQWRALPTKELLGRLVNDLEPAAFDVEPRVGELRETLERLLGRVVRMSGSGSSLFTLFDEQAEATNAQDRIRAELKFSAVAVEVAPQLRDDAGVW